MLVSKTNEHVYPNVVETFFSFNSLAVAHCSLSTVCFPSISHKSDLSKTLNSELPMFHPEWFQRLLKLVVFMAQAEKGTSWGHVVLASCKVVRHTHTYTLYPHWRWLGMGGREMSGGIEVIAFQRDKHTFHMAPRRVIIYCPIGHVLPPLNVFIFINIFFIYFLQGHCAEEMILKSNIWRAIVTARMQFVFHLRGKKGAVMPRGGHFVPCSDIFNWVPAGHWDTAWATRSSSWQTACALHRGHTDCLSKALRLTQYAGPRLASKGYERCKESLWV